VQLTFPALAAAQPHIQAGVVQAWDRSHARFDLCITRACFLRFTPLGKSH